MESKHSAEEITPDTIIKNIVDRYVGAFPDTSGIKEWKTWNGIRESLKNDLKSVASIAWEAGCNHGFNPEEHYSTAQAKETFLKQLLKGE